MDGLVKLTEIVLMPNDIVSRVNFAYRLLAIATGNPDIPTKFPDALKEGFGEVDVFSLLMVALEDYRLDEDFDENDAVENFCINYLKSVLQDIHPLKDINGNIAQYWDSVYLSDVQETVVELLVIATVAMVEQILAERNIGQDGESLCLIVEEAQKTLYKVGVYLDERDHDTVSP